MKLYIGIITLNRLESLKELVGNIRLYTSASYELAVADGDSKDGTVSWCIENGVRVITGPDRGIARNKNLLLYHFLHHSDCDQILILEDDCRVWEVGWEQEWTLACKAWDHVNWPVCPTQNYEHGNNTPGSPIRTNWFGGHCTITSRSGIEKVGYLDPRFLGYGGEHVEWTWRFYRQYLEQWGEPSDKNKTVPCLGSHVGVLFEDSLFAKDIYKKNLALMHRLMEEDQTVYREPWRTDEEKLEFIRCIDGALKMKPTADGLAGERCPLCRGVGVKLGEKDGVTVRQCCGIVLSWAWQNERDYLSWYADGDTYHVKEQEANGQSSYVARDAEHVAASYQRIELIRRLRPEARTLADIGSGTGALVAAAKRFGFDSIGLEPNSKLVDFARSIGRRVIRGVWNDLDFKYDVICLIDVFEHLTRPRECLDFILEHLDPCGLLVVEMPEAGCFQNLKDGINWKHVRPRQHLCVYSDVAARKLFYVSNYEVEFSLRPLRGSLGKIMYGLTPAQK